MSAMTATGADLFGTASTDADQAVRFWRAWFADHLAGGEGVGVGGFGVVSGFDAQTGDSLYNIAQPVRTMIDAAGGGDIDSLSWCWVKRKRDGRRSERELHRSNAYSRVGLVRERPARGRGRDRDALWTPGVVVDLDVGDGKFRSRDAWLAVLDRARVAGAEASVVVFSGGDGPGGGHAYWRVAGGLEPGRARAIGQRMRVWMESLGTELAGAEVRLDAVHDSSRIMRLPGSLRFPKAGERDQRPTLCEVAWTTGAVLDFDVFIGASAEAWVVEEEREVAAAAVRADWESRKRDVVAWAGRELASGGLRAREMDWKTLLIVGTFDDIFARMVSWEQIFAGTGWALAVDSEGVMLEPDSDGRRVWTRPGGGANPRSLVTDFGGAERCASLLSLAPETGLLRLHRNGIGLSKLAVAAELHRGGDVGALLREFLTSGGAVAL